MGGVTQRGLGKEVQEKDKENYELKKENVLVTDNLNKCKNKLCFIKNCYC